MIAVLGGFGAALCWATATLCAARSARLIGAPSVLAWVMLVGFVVAAPLTVAGGLPETLGTRELWWLLLAGAGNVAGLLLVYVAFRAGKVSIVAPITSTEGAIAAVLAVIGGEAIGVGAAAMLVAIVAGVVLASIAPGDGSGDSVRAASFAAGAASCFGVSLFAIARISEALPLVWTLIPARVLGVVVVALPLLVSRSLRITREAFPLVAAAGLCEVVGIALFALGSRHGIAVAAVVASQFAALAAVAAYVLFGERLTRLQVVGVVTIAVGVAVLTALQA